MRSDLPKLFKGFSAVAFSKTTGNQRRSHTRPNEVVQQHLVAGDEVVDGDDFPFLLPKRRTDLTEQVACGARLLWK